MQWCRKKEVRIAFIEETVIEKNSKGTQTHSSFVLMLIAKKARKIIAYIRKGMEKKIEIVKERDNNIII